MAYALQPSSHDVEEQSSLNVIPKVRRSPNRPTKNPYETSSNQQHSAEYVNGGETTLQTSHVRTNTWLSRGNTVSQVTVGCSGMTVGSGVHEQQPSLRIGVVPEDTDKMRDRMFNSNGNSPYFSPDAWQGPVQPPAPVSGSKTWTNRPYLSVTVAPQIGDSFDRKLSCVAFDTATDPYADPGLARDHSGIQTPQQQSEMTAPSAPNYLRQTPVENNHHKYAKYPSRVPNQNTNSFYGTEQTGQTQNAGGGGWGYRAPESDIYGGNYPGQGYYSPSPHHSYQQHYPNRYQQQQQHQQQQQQQQHQMPPSYCNPQQDHQNWRTGNDARYGYNDPNNFVLTPGNSKYPGGGGKNMPMMQAYNNSSNPQLTNSPSPMQQWSDGPVEHSMSNMSGMESGSQRTPSSYSTSNNNSLARCVPPGPVARVGVPPNVTSSLGANYGGMSANWRAHSRYPNNPQQQSQQHTVPPAYRPGDVGGGSPGPYQQPNLTGRRPDHPDNLGNDQYYGHAQVNREFAAHQTTTNAPSYSQQPG
ncbi:hypothetical protein TcG_03328 [Trypanosoma cruzi]|nr:hypothetical protein TcG_03328 [Trypanosoma cruzi]